MVVRRQESDVRIEGIRFSEFQLKLTTATRRLTTELKDSTGEFQHFLRNALGSCNEVRVLLELCKDLGYIEEEIYQGLDEHYQIIGKQLYRLREANKS